MRTLLLLCLMLAVAGSLCASQTAASTQTVPQVVSLQVLALEGMITDLDVRSPQGRTRLIARASAFSPPVSASVQNGLVTFFSRSARSAAARPHTAEAEPVAASFAVEPGTDRYLVIIAASGQGAQRQYHAYAIADSGQTPPRHARVINFTDNALAVRLGSDTAVVPRSRSVVLPCSPGADGHTDLRLARPQADGEWQLVSSTRVAVPEKRRVLLLITPERPAITADDGVAMAAGSAFNVRVVLDAPPPQVQTASLDR